MNRVMATVKENETARPSSERNNLSNLFFKRNETILHLTADG